MAFEVQLFVEDAVVAELFLTVGIELGHDGAGVTFEGAVEVEHEGEVFELAELGPWAPVVHAKAAEAFDHDYNRLAGEYRLAEADPWRGL